MIRFVLPAILLSTLTPLQADEPVVRTLATELPTVPEGVVPATYAMPRTEWVVNVSNLIKKGQEAAEKTQVVLDGDSITAGWRRFWDSHFGETPTFNFAMGGDRTQHLLWRVAQGQLANFKPKLVVLMIGTNNLGNGETPADTALGVEAVVKQYRQHCPNATILLQGLLPRGKNQADRVKEVNAAISKLHDGEKVFYVDFAKAFTDEKGQVRTDLMPDSLHPNAEGYKVWAAELKPQLEKLISKE